MSGVRCAAGLARHPGRVAGRTRDLAAELARIGLGRSEVAPHEKDRRFADDGWSGNPVLRRLLQSYLATGQAARGLVADADLDWGDDQRMSFIVDNLVEASSPSNNPFLNPVVLKRMLDTGGGNLVEGGRRFVRDFASAPRVPSMVEPDAFEVGTDIAVTPGAVVLRTDVFELIQYTPQTTKVRAVPLLIVPPTINKYYVIDLAEQRSLVEHLVANGQQVYCISWRNPDARHADWGLDTYGAAIIEAMDTAQKIARQDQVALFALCSGGMLTSMVLGHLAAIGDLGRVSAFSLAVTVLDQAQCRPAERAAVAQGRCRVHEGVEGEGLPRRSDAGRGVRLAPAQRPDLELLGQQLPDGPRPQAVRHPLLERRPGADDRGHAPRLHGARDQQRAHEPGGSRMLGSDIDLGKVDTDAYAVAGIADHLCAWESCYSTTQLLGGDTKFVLSTSGHIASMVNPPGNEKASFQSLPMGSSNPEDPADWLSKADKVKGTWWDDYVEWLSARTGPERGKPRRMGSADFPPLCDAPGTYVLDR